MKKLVNKKVKEIVDDVCDSNKIMKNVMDEIEWVFEDLLGFFFSIVVMIR